MVSVIIPTYNRADTIKRSIESVLRQSYQNFEVIVIDDGSTDDTCRVVDEIGDSRICYIKSDRRMGANAARNTGIQRAKGEYIAFQDSDDIWRKDKLKMQMDLFREKDDVDIIYSRYLCHYANGETALVPNKTCEYTKELLQEDIMSILAKSNVIGTPTMIVRKRCFNEYGMFDLELQRFQDWEINIKFVQHYKYGFIDEALVDAYRSSDSITNIVNNSFDSILLIVNKHQQFFEAQNALDIHLTWLADMAMNEKKLKGLQDTLGETLFFRSIYSYYRNKEGRLEVIKKNYNFVKEWISREKNNYIVNSYLHKYKDNAIALYGLGEIGQLFLNALTDENKKKVKYVIDRKKLSYNGYEWLFPEALTDKNLEEVDCIIITAIAHEYEIRRELEKLITIPVISVYDVLSEI